MNLLITGATGFVGSNLSRFFVSKDHSVTIVVREESSFLNIEDIKDQINVVVYDGTIDSLQKGILKYNIDTVLHLASLFVAEHTEEQVDPLLQSNIVMGTHLLEAMRMCGVKRLINTGTSWQYYHQDSYSPVSLYAATKQAFHDLVAYYVKAEGFSAIDLILYDNYGENDRRPKLINLLHQFSDEKKVLDMSEGDQRLFFVHIMDVCCAYEKAIMLIDGREGDYQEYVVRGEQSYSLKELIAIFEKVTSKKVLINWGKRPYRRREVMKPYDGGEVLPNWKPNISLEEGLRLF